MRTLQKLYREDEIKEFKELLENHDWFYHQSHDNKVYLKGQYEYLKIKHLADINIELYFIYQEYRHKIYDIG